MANAMKEAYMRGSKHKGGEKELKRVTIQESDNGGFIVECSYEIKHQKEDKEGMQMACPIGYEETKKVFENWEGVADMLDDLFGDGEDED